LFSRQNDEIEFGDSWGGSGALLRQHTRTNALVLSTAAMLNVEQPAPVFDWFSEKLRIVMADLEPVVGLKWCFDLAAADPSFQTFLDNLVHAADVGIERVNMEEVPWEPVDEESFRRQWPLIREELVEARLREIRERVGTGASQGRVYTVHRRPDGSLVYFDPIRDESRGTLKLLCSAPLWHGLMDGDRTLAVDELETRYHPALTERLLKEVHQASGTHQLLFTTHDESLMESASLRRDQVWFLEKRALAASKLYSLWDFRSRKGQSNSRAYRQGRFGAVPILGELGLVSE
jgi:hypothetical protein